MGKRKSPAHMSPPNKPFSPFDARVRIQLYRYILRWQLVPSSAELARAVRRPAGEIRPALHRLAAAHAIILEPGGRRILRAAPFWGSPTGFAMDVGTRSYWASCIWDALGVPAMLGKDALVRSSCGCCSEAMEIRVSAGRLRHSSGVIHFAVPARRWYQDTVYT